VGIEKFDLVISVKTGAGLDRLVDMISAKAGSAVGRPESLIPARARHVSLLREASARLNDSLAGGAALGIRAEELRRAGVAVGKIAGMVDVEEVLGVIFSEFCIGK